MGSLAAPRVESIAESKAPYGASGDGYLAAFTAVQAQDGQFDPLLHISAPVRDDQLLP